MLDGSSTVKKNTKYFLNLEKRNKSQHTIHKVANDHGQPFVNNKDILRVIFHFFSTLYTSKSCNPSPFSLGFRTIF